MSELFYMENWDLQAVVGGNSSDMENPSFSFDIPAWSFQQEEYEMSSFPDIYGANPNVLDELEELYKPFYPDHHDQLNDDDHYFSTQTIVTSSLPAPALPRDMDEAENQIKRQQYRSVSEQSAPTTIKECSTQTVPNKPRRSSRKNQQNRVVQHVTADGLSSDKWAWRKYGQKPIKGSPYPRSYYRCSSSKGCLARKQVERSCTDPRTFIITYTAEHSHGQPTRRNSLAGSTRTKLSSPPKTATLAIAKLNINSSTESHDQAAAESASLLSPTMSFTAKDDQAALQQISIKMEEQVMFEDQGELGAKILSPDIMLSSSSSEELAQSYDSFEGLLFLDQFPDLSHQLWSTLQP